MRQPSALAQGRTEFVNGGRVRGVRVRVRDGGDEADEVLAMAVALAGLFGMVMGLAGSNASLVLGWLS